MFLKMRHDGSLMEVLNLRQLFDPFASGVDGHLHAGEEVQDQETFQKSDLEFPSGEGLPRCWVDPAYREH
ncbi:MAG: acetyltransferase [Vulcanococcus sp.]